MPTKEFFSDVGTPRWYTTATLTKAEEAFFQDFIKNPTSDLAKLFNKYTSGKERGQVARVFPDKITDLTADQVTAIKKRYKNYRRFLPNLQKIQRLGLTDLREIGTKIGIPEDAQGESIRRKIIDPLSRKGTRGKYAKRFINKVLRPKFKLQKLYVGEGLPTWFMKEPKTTEEIASLEEYFKRTGSKVGITDETLSRIKKLRRYPTYEGINIIDKFRQGKLENGIVENALKTKFGWTGSQSSTVFYRMGQLLNGHKFPNVDYTLPIDKAAAKDIFTAFEKAPFSNVFHTRAYQVAMETITDALKENPKFKGNMASFKKNIRRILNKNGIPGTKWQINELIGVTPTTRTGAYPYSQFVNLMEKKFNTGQYADYVKQLGKYQVELQGAKDPSSVISKYDTYAKNFRELHGLKKTELPTLSTQHPSELYSAKRLAQLEAQGLDLPAHFKKAKYSIGVGEKTPTLGEVQTAFRESPELIKKINKSPYKKIIELRVGCADGCLAAVAKDEPGKITKAIETLPQKARGFLGMLGRGGLKAAPFAALAAVGAAAEPLVKKFMADDPTTYLTNENQMKGMLLATIEGEPPKVDEEILKWQMPAHGAATLAGAVPGAGEVYKARRGLPPTKDFIGPMKKGVGPTRAALGISGVLGKALGATFSPLAGAAMLPLHVAAQRKGGTDWGDIATDPAHWMTPAFAATGAEAAAKGIKNPLLLKALRLGMSPRTLRLISSRLGMPGLALTAGMWGYDKWKKARDD